MDPSGKFPVVNNKNSSSAPAMLDPKHSERLLKKVSMLMHEAVHMQNSSLPNATLHQLREFGVDREKVKGLVQHYLSLKTVKSTEATNEEKASVDGLEATCYGTERDLRAVLVPLSSLLFEQMNGQVGGLKFLVDLRADLKTTLELEDIEVNNQAYLNRRVIAASPALVAYLQGSTGSVSQRGKL